MRPWTALALAALVGACGSEPEPPPRWPGTVAYSAEVAPATRLDILTRAGDAAPRRLTNGRADEFSPSWAPDGAWLAYRVNPPRGDEGDIWTMRADGTGKRNLTRSPGVADWSPAVSPDGRRIAYMSAHEIWVMDADGGAARQLTEAGELSEYPSWSPDGETLAFGAHRGGNFEIARIDAEGGEETNLTRHPARDQWPAWSPDGEQIAFMSDRDGKEDVFVMRADGSEVRNVTRTSDRFETHPAWTADGRLTFYRHAEGPVSIVVEGDEPYMLPVDGAFLFDWTP